ncbi:MAG: prepilin-type N-terminal cleavage/methylation domain-containing protein [Patescibacteria group bacterium]|nr:prepilin-type N-terminal cleavage/methylation domain-containing protein [Patescibacteria group bacterium]
MENYLILKRNKLQSSFKRGGSIFLKGEGFTLIELLIVSAFLMLVGSVGFFTLRNQQLGNLESDARIIISRLSEAQSRARAGVQGTDWGLYFNNATPSSAFYALFQSSAYTTSTETYYLSNSIEFQTPASGATTSIAFTKLTGRTGATSSIVIRLKNNTSINKTITVRAQGQITSD